MSQEQCSRPRRAGANYGPPPRDRLLNISLTHKRKDLIMNFKKVNKKGQNSDKWLHKLFHFLNEQDEQILIEDVRRWVENHSWITSPGGQPPEALKVRNQGDTPTTKTKATSVATSTSVPQATPPKNDDKATFKTPELEACYISPRPSKTPTRKAPKARLVKHDQEYFSMNK